MKTRQFMKLECASKDSFLSLKLNISQMRCFLFQNNYIILSILEFNTLIFFYFQDTLFNGLGLGAVIGLGVAALLLILVVTDVSCFFIRQCGLLMCITRRMCGKKSGSSGKSKELEEGKAAYLWVSDICVTVMRDFLYHFKESTVYIFLMQT